MGTIDASSLDASTGSLFARYPGALSNEEFWQYATSLAQVSSETPAQEEQFLVCHLREAQCLLALNTVHEVIPLRQRVTSLPAVPPWMVGITAWHDECIAVVDLAAYLLQENYRQPERCTLLITRLNALYLGLLVSSVDILSALPVAAHMPADQIPSWCTNLHSGVVAAWYEQGPLLDLTVVLADIVQCIGTVSMS